MTINPIIRVIRAKKLGVLIRDARLKSGKSIEDCAQALGISAEDLSAMEYGERPPTLPEIEILAFYLEIPLEHFWENEVYTKNGNQKDFDAEEIKQLRQKTIATLIHKARIEADLSIDELAEGAGISAAELESYEGGQLAIPLPELETIAKVLNNSVADFEDKESAVGSWIVEQKNMKEFMALPKELQEFIGKPINRPYLDLAIKLSELKAERLRALAEGLLEITF